MTPAPRPLRTLFAVLIASAGLLTAQDGDSKGPELEGPGPEQAASWAGMKARSIGPAGMSGRVASLAVDPTDRRRLFVGAATGGLWRSDDQGTSWRPVFDDQRVASIGAVAIHPRRPDQIWVGTGEGNPRNSASVGDGVFRSNDGGETWRRAGLEGSERIHRLVLHPEDPQTAWAGVMGPAWSDSTERGVWKTTDGGQTWRQVLSAPSEQTGCADLVVDARNPDRLLASMWQFYRRPWTFQSGGEHSGLWASDDGGETWSRRGEQDGLPEGDLGRIGLAWSDSDPEVVYALVEAEKSALCRSTDGGRTFAKVNTETNVNPRPFYFADIRVDPSDANTVYRLQTVIDVSYDGGKTFEELVPWQLAHPDHHAMWIDPSDPRHLWIGNDGGVYRSTNRGESWDFCENLPLAQFYHVRVDLDRPYNIYGGMQDNGSWRGPAWVPENGGIRNLHWAEIGFGDGFDAAPDPEDSMQGYAMSQEGYLSRWNLRTGERKSIRPWAPEGEKLRFNWDAAFAQSPHDTATIYYGSQFVHRSKDRGASWEIVSGDLTTDDPEHQQQDDSGGLTPDATGAENYTTITAIAPSRATRGIVWAGTDDGRLHVTADDCQSWNSVESNLEGLPEGLWCQQIVPDHLDKDVAFVVFDGHRSGDWDPHVFRTEDLGLTWTRIASAETGVDGYALAIAQDPVDPSLLFLGTEFGLFVTLDGGGQWQRFDHGLPTVACRDLVIHPREHDLVVGTHGRAAYVLDDIRPLRELRDVGDRGVFLFEPPPAELYRVRQTPASRFPADTEFRGENRAYGARLSFWVAGEDLPTADEPLRDDEEHRATILVTATDDPAAPTVARFEVPVHQGINRTTWSLRTGFTRSPGDAPRKPTDEPGAQEVIPGDYRVEIRFGDQSHARTLRVVPDHRELVAASATLRRFEVLRDLSALQSQCADMVDTLREQAGELREKKVQEGFRALRMAAYGLPEARCVLLPGGERIPALNGASDPQVPGFRTESRSTPFAVEVLEGRDWYRCADGSRFTTTDDGVVVVPADDEDGNDENSDNENGDDEEASSPASALEKLADELAGPEDPKGIPGGQSVLSQLGEARGAVSSTFDAPSSSVMKRVGLARTRAKATLNEATEALLRVSTEAISGSGK